MEQTLWSRPGCDHGVHTKREDNARLNTAALQCCHDGLAQPELYCRMKPELQPELMMLKFYTLPPQLHPPLHLCHFTQSHDVIGHLHHMTTGWSQTLSTLCCRCMNPRAGQLTRPPALIRCLITCRTRLLPSHQAAFSGLLNDPTEGNTKSQQLLIGN